MIKQFFKKVFISYLIIISCIFLPTYRAYAVSPSGWSFSSYDIATAILSAFKNGVKTSAPFVPSAPTIAKTLAKGGGAAAIAYVAAKYGSDVYDWAYDELTKSVVGTPKSNAVLYSDPITGAGAMTGDQACQNLTNYYISQDITAVGQLTFRDGACYRQNGIMQARLVQVSGANVPPVSYSVDTLANTAVDDAKTGNPGASSAVIDAAKDSVNDGQADTALSNAATDTNVTHNCGAGTSWNGSACVADTPTTPTPFDPSSIIDAINSVFNAVMSLPSVINDAIDKVLDAVASIADVINLAIEKVINAIKDIIQPIVDLITSFIDWFKDKLTALYDALTDFFDWVKTSWDEFVKPADNEPTELDIPNNVPTPTDTNIRFGGMCPPNAEINVRIPFATINATLFDWSKWCYNLDTFVKPVIILLAAYFSVLIFRGKNESS